MAGDFAGSSDDEVISAINITPLVYVVLVLLIIFMITAPVLYQSVVKVQLPKTKTGESQDKTPLSFIITKDGELVMGREKITWDILDQRLKSFGDDVANQTAVISADQATTHGSVIRLMDALRQIGLTRFALNVESEQQAKP